MVRNLEKALHRAIIMGLFITVSFWWFSGSTFAERVGNIWLLAVFLPIFVVSYFVLGPRISAASAEAVMESGS